MDAIPFDTSSLAVITGGASGFGFEVASRLIKAGMSTVILDVSEAELAEAEKSLKSFAQTSDARVLCVRCNVTKIQECKDALQHLEQSFPGEKIGFLFNNAGISGNAGSSIINSTTDSWKPIFDVNVYGAANILQAFIPKIIEDGSLPSGKPVHVVTTSSVVGLLNHNIGAYSISKFAVTAMCEQFAIELERLGEEASHIFPHTLHPTVAETNFLASRDSDGTKQAEAVAEMFKGKTTSANEIIDGFFRGLRENESYIIVDGKMDIPTHLQLANRFADQTGKLRPRAAEQLGAFILLMGNERLVGKRQKQVKRLRNSLL